MTLFNCFFVHPGWLCNAAWCDAATKKIFMANIRKIHVFTVRNSARTRCSFPKRKSFWYKPRPASWVERSAPRCQESKSPEGRDLFKFKSKNCDVTGNAPADPKHKTNLYCQSLPASREGTKNSTYPHSDRRDRLTSGQWKLQTFVLCKSETVTKPDDASWCWQGNGSESH